MRRFLNLVAIISLLLAVLAVGLWIASYSASVQIGSLEVEMDPFGTVLESREGVFLHRGRLTYSSGTRMVWPEPGPRPEPKVGKRSGVFFGDFGLWADARPFVLGFGSRRGSDAGSISISPWSGESIAVSTPIAWWLLLFLAAPIWRAAGRRMGLSAAAVLVDLLLTWGLLIAFAAIAVPLPALGGLILLYLAIVLTWVGGRYGVRIWQEVRALRRAGRCRVCGYDLRATPDPDGPLLERCPECGTFSRAL